MIEISAYIFLAILLGYFFGWLTTKLLLKERYQTHLDDIMLNKHTEIGEINKIKDELYEYKKNNKRLKIRNQELSSGYDGQRYVLDEHNATLDELQKRLQSKDEVIESLRSKLSAVEEKIIIEKKYEEEIDAFMFERIDITQNYKDLLEKPKLLKRHKGMLKVKDSWFSKFFASSSTSVNLH